MKKSKILAVALSALTFSTAAAVTGTVAWYFAQRTVSVSMSSITSFNPESGLKVTLAKKIGTTLGTASSSSASAPATVTHGKIRDGSVDLETPLAYKTRLSNNGQSVLGYEPLDLDSADEMHGKSKGEGESTAVDFYYATSYEAKFELTRKVAGSKFAVYYDNAQLKVEGSSLVQESLRIGFRFDAGTNSDTDDNFFVIAPFRNANGGKFVNGTTLNNEGDYENIGSPAEKRILYGYETEYKKNVINDYNGDPVTIDDFDYDHYKDNDMFIEVATSLDGENNPVITTEQAYSAKIKDVITDDNLAGIAGSVAEDDAPETLGFLGILDADAQANQDGLAVKAMVYTWFEGLDDSSITDWVDDKPLKVDLTFDMVEVE